MNIDDARRIIAEAAPASEAEVEAGRQRLMTDPKEARLGYMALMTMAADDPQMDRAADLHAYTAIHEECSPISAASVERLALAVGRMLADL